MSDLKFHPKAFSFICGLNGEHITAFGATDSGAPYEGRANLREVTREEWEAYRRRDPGGDWNVSTPVGTALPERYFIPKTRGDEAEPEGVGE